MLKAEQIPWQAKEQLGRWLASGASHEECIAAAINAWPGMMHIFEGEPGRENAEIILPLKQENNNAEG